LVYKPQAGLRPNKKVGGGHAPTAAAHDAQLAPAAPATPLLRASRPWAPPTQTLGAPRLARPPRSRPHAHPPRRGTRSAGRRVRLRRSFRRAVSELGSGALFPRARPLRQNRLSRGLRVLVRAARGRACSPRAAAAQTRQDHPPPCARPSRCEAAQSSHPAPAKGPESNRVV